MPELLKTANDLGMSQWVIDRITPRNAKSAWTRASYFRAPGRPSRLIGGFDPDKSRSRYVTRDIGEDARALVREVIDVDGERASSETVANLYFTPGTSSMYFNITEFGASNAVQEAEVRGVLAGISREMQEQIGGIGELRIRQILRSWLENNHRVCARGAGGVYFIPRPSDTGHAAAVEQEMLALRNWVTSKPIGSLFSIVEVSKGGATTMDSFINSAVDEIKAEIEDIATRLQGWASNGNMNDGSKMFSADAMFARAGALSEKVDVLTQSLGDEIGVMAAMVEIVRNQALEMRDHSSASLKLAASNRSPKKVIALAPVAAEEPVQAETPVAPAPIDETDAADQMLALAELIPPVEKPVRRSQRKVVEDTGKKSGTVRTRKPKTV